MISLWSKTLSFLLLPLLLVVVTMSAVPNFSIEAVSGRFQKPLVIVIVDSSIYTALKPSLDQYAVDVENSGFSVNITRTDQISNQTPSGIREYLKKSLSYGLVGTVLVGDVPEAWFKVGSHEFPTDAYYMDLEGQWFDLDHDGIYDARGALEPEIWVGRLKASTVPGDEISLLKNYFSKDHSFRTGSLKIPWSRSLIYIDDMGVVYSQDAGASLSYVSPYEIGVTDGATTNSTDYKSRLADPLGYQWLYLMCHGQISNHTFYYLDPHTGVPVVQGTVYSSDYATINPRVSFYQLFVCSAARYTAQDYLAGSMVFRTSWGLAAIGSTDDMYSYSFNDFYKALSEGESLGAAFKLWLSNAVVAHINDYASNTRYQTLFNAMTFVGDPTLSPIIEKHDVAVTGLKAVIRNESNQETLVINVTVENHGDFVENVTVRIYYDLQELYSVSTFLKIGGSCTVTYSPSDSSKYVLGAYEDHMIEAVASILSGELGAFAGDNYKIMFLKGELIKVYQLPQFPPIIFAILFDGFLALIAWTLMKQLASDRPALLVYLRKIRKRLTNGSLIKP